MTHPHTAHRGQEVRVAPVDNRSWMTQPRTARSQASRPRMRQVLAAMCMLLSFHASLAMADAIKLGDLWIENVTVDTFDGVNLHYLVNGSSNKQFLTKIDGFRIAAYPQLDEAEKALKAGNAKSALTHFKAARGRAREAWLRMWLDARLVPMLDKEGESLAAVNTYLSLVETKAPQSFLEVPPVRSVRALAKEDKAKVHERFKAARKGVTEKTPLADALDELIEISIPSDDAAPVTPGTPDAMGDKIASEVPMPAFMLTDKADAITKMITRSRFEQALARVEEDMKNAAGGGKTSLLLYQRGLCQFYLAQQMEKDPSKKEQARTLYEDAGLSFYRIPTFFRTSLYVGPALVETAAVHVKINRPDVAAKLLEAAGAMIDTDDKMMADRMEKLREQISAATNP